MLDEFTSTRCCRCTNRSHQMPIVCPCMWPVQTSSGVERWPRRWLNPTERQASSRRWRCRPPGNVCLLLLLLWWVRECELWVSRWVTDTWWGWDWLSARISEQGWGFYLVCVGLRLDGPDRKNATLGLHREERAENLSYWLTAHKNLPRHRSPNCTGFLT
jgi:hypothetical protein